MGWHVVLEISLKVECHELGACPPRALPALGGHHAPHTAGHRRQRKGDGMSSLVSTMTLFIHARTSVPSGTGEKGRGPGPGPVRLTHGGSIQIRFWPSLLACVFCAVTQYLCAPEELHAFTEAR